jgi:hypothetical protein
VREVPIDPRRELAGRIAASAAFQKSNRLRQLFLFLCERAISSPGTVVHEQDIGAGVFGRPADYDTSQDTLVRTNVYQLRKKLQQYFEAEGRAEPIIVEIPRGVYTPVFCDRPAENENEEPVPAPVTAPAPTPRSRLTFVFAVLALAGAVLSIWLAVRGGKGNSASLGPGFGPVVDRVWLQVFGNGRNTSVVLADTNMAFFSHVTGREIDLRRYKAKEFNRLVDETIHNPEQREGIKTLLLWYGTSVGDARTAARIAALHAIHRLPLNIVPARDFETSELQSNNVVLLGGTTSNPWVELFNPKLRYFAPANWKPGVEGYCRVALLPNIGGGGNILMLAGTDEASVAAGIELVSDERRVGQLRSALHLGKRDRIPFFEVLLKVQVLAGSPAGIDIVSSRVIPQ